MEQSPGKIEFTDRDTQAYPFSAYAQINATGGIYREESTGFYVVTNYELLVS